MNTQWVAAVCAALMTAPAAAQDVTIAGVPDGAPKLPASFAATFVPPARDPSGSYMTPNRNLAGDEVTWHVRVALNVAALGCRGIDDGQVVAAYNGLLAVQQQALAAAGDGVATLYKAKFGTGWQAHSDDDMTRLYNFWAQPAARDGFCTAARGVLAEAATVEPGAFATFAAAAMPRLEAPFIAAFATFDDYRRRLAAWRQRSTTRIVIATNAPTPVSLATTVVEAAPAPSIRPDALPRLGPDGP